MKSASFAVGFQRPATAGRAGQRGQGRPGAPRPAGAQTQRRPRALRRDVGRCPGRCAPQQLPLRSGSRAPSFPSAWEGSSRIRWCFCKRFQTKPSARSCSGSPASFSPQPKSPATAAARPLGSRFLCSLSCCSFSVFFFFFLSLSYSLPPFTNCPISVTFLRSFSRLYSRGRRRLGGTTCRAQRAELGAAEQRGHSGHSSVPQLGTTAGSGLLKGLWLPTGKRKTTIAPPLPPPKEKTTKKQTKIPCNLSLDIFYHKQVTPCSVFRDAVHTSGKLTHGTNTLRK